MIKRKEFEKLFQPFSEQGKQIWVITRVKELSQEIITMALNLASLDFINYIQISDEALMVSNINCPNRPKVPFVNELYPDVNGIHLIYSDFDKVIDFWSIASSDENHYDSMVETILKDFPNEWTPCIMMMSEEKYWKKKMKKYNTLEWMY
jgi:hypothetical protein